MTCPTPILLNFCKHRKGEEHGEEIFNESSEAITTEALESLNYKDERNKLENEKEILNLFEPSEYYTKVWKGGLANETIESKDLSFKSFLNPSKTGEECREKEKKHKKGCEDIIAKEALESGDILRDIFLRLPWRDVTCFKSVSKQWLRLISEPSFNQEYQARNPFLLGFLHNSLARDFNFIPVPSPSKHYIDVVQQRIGNLKSMNSNVITLSSSNGLFLQFQVNEGYYFLHNPITSQTIRLPYPPPNLDIRSTVYGLAFDLFNKYLIIVKVIPNGTQGLQVISFSSKTCIWKSEEHNIVKPSLGEEYTLLGHSTFLNDSLHWLLVPSGIIAYNIKSESFSFSLLSVPVDEVDKLCHCSEFRRMTSQFYPSCVCRFLGESQDNLIYARVNGDSHILVWTLDNYNLNEWSLRHNVVVENVPFSLAIYGKVLAFDPRDSQVMFIRLNDHIYSCDLKKKKMKIHYIEQLPISSIFPYKLTLSVSPQHYFPLIFENSLRYGIFGNKVADSEELIQLNERLHAYDGSREAGYMPLQQLSIQGPHVEMVDHDSRSLILLEWFKAELMGPVYGRLAHAYLIDNAN